METREYQRVRKVNIRKGDVVERAAEFQESAFSLLYAKAEKIIRDIVEKREENGRNGHLLSFMGERGSGKTTAMLSFLRALKEKEREKSTFLTDCGNVRFLTFDVIDASMLEEEEDLFEIILAQMLVDFLKNCDSERVYGDSWGAERTDAKKTLQKKFNDLLEGFRSLKKHGGEDELTSLATLKNLSFSSRLRQNFQSLVKAYISYGQEACYDAQDGPQTYLVFAIDDLDMNISKGFAMLGQIHRYMLVPNVIIMVTAKYEQLEILGRKYFSGMLERLDRETEEWKVRYLDQTVKQYLEKMMPSYYRLYLPAFGEGAMRYGDTLIVEREGKSVKTVILRKIFHRTGVYFDGSGDEQHYLVPVSMRGLNDYYLFLEDLVKLKSSRHAGRNLNKEQRRIAKDNLDKFQNDFAYRYVLEQLEIEDREGIYDLINRKYSGWNLYLHQYMGPIVSWFMTGNEGNSLDTNDRILLEMFMRDQNSFGNVLWGISWFVENNWRRRAWKNCITALYSLELNRRIWEGEGLDKAAFGGSVVGIWTNQIFPQTVFLQEAMKKESVRFAGSVKGCKATIDFIWEVELPPRNTVWDFWDWLYTDRDVIRSIEIITLFFEAFHDNSIKSEKIRMESKVVPGEMDKMSAIVKIENRSLDFNLLGFLTNLLECETFYRELHEVFILSWRTFFKAEDEIGLEELIEKFRNREGLSLYREMEEWNQKAKGLVLPYQHTDIYINLLEELRQWSMMKLSKRFSDLSAWELLKEVVLQMEVLLREKEKFLREIDSEYDGSLLRNFQDCPVIKCIKDYQSMGLCEDFPEKFGAVFEQCRTRNDYDNLYDPESEIDTPEDANEKK